MKLAELTWPDVAATTRNELVVIPTGSLEQHGPHLPLFTDSLIVTAVAEAVERELGDRVLLTPTLWLGASGHHLRFPGTLSASFPAYQGAIESVVESLLPHRFRLFYVLNGHGGNSEPNGVAMRQLKASHRDCVFGHSSYYSLVMEEVAAILTGPMKDMRHACEAETSLMAHLHPNLVRTNKIRDDVLRAKPAAVGIVHHFDEMTEEGSFGYATMASSDKGRAIFDAAVRAVRREFETVLDEYCLNGENR